MLVSISSTIRSVSFIPLVPISPKLRMVWSIFSSMIPSRAVTTPSSIAIRGYSFLIDIPLARLHVLWSDFFKQLQSVFRSTHQRPQCDGNRQAGHPCAGDAHSHRVFQHVGTQLYLDGFGAAAQYFSRLGRAERHRDGFGTAHRGDNLLLHDRLDARSLFYREHLNGSFRFI